MKTRIIVLLVLALIIFACNKDKFTTIPQVTVKSISPTTVNNGNIITVDGEYTDDEGDLDSVLVVYKWYNASTVVKKDTFRYAFSTLGVPDKTREAQIKVTYQYNTANPGPPTLSGVIKDTTATMGLILKDKKANRSNYSESKQIRLKKV
jgi:hypothetical protein